MTGCPSVDPRCEHTRATDYQNYGCRCDPARRSREHLRKTRHLRPPPGVPATGARRRIQALMVMGWSQNDINEQLGRKRSGGLGMILWSDRPTVLRSLDRRIRDLYDRLADTPGSSRITTTRAVARGWLGPLWWDDDTIDDPTHRPDTRDRRTGYVDQIAVEQAAQGRQGLRLNTAERAEAVRRLHGRGYSDGHIGDVLGLDERSVFRIRQRLALPANTPSGRAA